MNENWLFSKFEGGFQNWSKIWGKAFGLYVTPRLMVLEIGIIVASLLAEIPYHRIWLRYERRSS